MRPTYDSEVERRQLEYLVAISDEGTVQRAAEALHTTQPSVSRGLRALERELGVPLFQRRGRGLVATEAGSTAIEQARLVLRRMNSLAEEARYQSQEPRGLVEVCATPAPALEPMAAAIARMAVERPRVVVQPTKLESPAAVISGVRSGRFDLGMCGQATRPNVPGTTAHVIANPRLWLVAHRHWALGPSTLEAVQELGRVPIISTGGDTSSRDVAERLVAQLHPAPRFIEVHYRELIPQLIRHGVGAGVLSEVYLTGALESPAIERWPLSRRYSVPFWVIVRNDAAPAALHFAAALRSCADSRPSGRNQFQ